MTLAEYIHAEFSRYFPDATVISVWVNGETILVDVSRELSNTVWDCEIGSDDDYYVFNSSVTDAVLTIPLMAEG